MANVPELVTKKGACIEDKDTLSAEHWGSVLRLWQGRLSRCQIWAAIMIKIAIENPDGTLQVQCLCAVGLVEFWNLDKIQEIFILIPNMIQNTEQQVSFLLVICVPLILNEGDQTD